MQAQGRSPADAQQLALVGLSLTGLWGAAHFALGLRGLRENLNRALVEPV